MNPEVWVASDHIANFTDPLNCKSCGVRHRADKLIAGLPRRSECGRLDQRATLRLYQVTKSLVPPAGTNYSPSVQYDV